MSTLSPMYVKNKCFLFKHMGTSTPFTGANKCLLEKVKKSKILKTGGIFFRWQIF